MTRRAPRRHPARAGSLAGLLVALATAVAGCGTGAVTVESPAPPPVVAPAGAHAVHPSPPATPDKSCTDPTASIAPPAVMPAPAHMPDGSWMKHVQEQGFLRAGVDQNTYLWGYRDPETGQLSGFDIDILRTVSQAIFGSPDKIHFTVVPNADRVRAVQSGDVDIVAETMTINCQREKSIDFSTVYYQAGQRILVPTTSTITGPADLGGRRVCATNGSTSLQNLMVPPVASGVVPWAVDNESDCLVLLQQGLVDAISTDDAILQGLAAQDPNSTIVGPAFTREPYGLAISKDHPEFTAFVNGVLAADRADGTWAKIYAHWLGPFNAGVVPPPPPATYRSAG